MTEETAASIESGIVYLSRIPPSMTPHELRGYLEPFGKLGRVYMTPDDKTLKTNKHASKDPRDRKKARFIDGWVEFERRKDAKTAALALNGTLIGGKKSNRFHDDIWNIKYLKGFQWSNLSEQAIYERAVRQQKLKAEISQARKAASQYTRQAEKAYEHEKIEETKTFRRAAAEGIPTVKKSKEESLLEQMKLLKSKFKQRKPIQSNL